MDQILFIVDVSSDGPEPYPADVALVDLCVEDMVDFDFLCEEAK